MNYFDGSKDCWTHAWRQTTCMLFKNHAFHEFLEEQPVRSSQFVGKGRKNTRSWQKRERNRTSGVPPPHYTGLPSNLSRTSHFPLFPTNWKSEQAIGNEGNHPLLFHEISNQHFHEQHKFMHDMIYAFSLYSVLTKEKFSIQPFALKTAHLFCHFARISVYRTHADIGLSKRSKNNSSEKERFNIAKPGGPRMTGMMNLNLNSTTGTPRTIH